jgi:hypothetical protein
VEDARRGIKDVRETIVTGGAEGLGKQAQKAATAEPRMAPLDVAEVEVG